MPAEGHTIHLVVHNYASLWYHDSSVEVEVDSGY